VRESECHISCVLRLTLTTIHIWIWKLLEFAVFFGWWTSPKGAGGITSLSEYLLYAEATAYCEATHVTQIYTWETDRKIVLILGMFRCRCILSCCFSSSLLFVYSCYHPNTASPRFHHNLEHLFFQRFLSTFCYTTLLPNTRNMAIVEPPSPRRDVLVHPDHA
jgi:hypothetical protein